jgi:hypothetical protein
MRPGNASSWGRWWLLALLLLVGCATTPLREADGPPAQLALMAGGQGGPKAPGGLGPSGAQPMQPLTVLRLVQLAHERGIGVAGARVTRNRDIGLALQRTAMRCLEIPENFLPFPTTRRTHHGAVIPDGLVTAGKLQLAGRIFFDPEGAFLEVIDGDFLDMLDVKVRSHRITLSTGRGQLLGFIEVLAQRRPRAFVGALGTQPRPALLLVTPSDTEVSEDLAWEAARHGVAVYQAVAMETDGWLNVGQFIQKTKFADVAPSFQLPSKPMPLSL